MNNWVSVEDRLPNKNGKYLVAVKGKKKAKKRSFSGDVFGEMRKICALGGGCWMEWRRDWDVTHWMPLPRAPL